MTNSELTDKNIRTITIDQIRTDRTQSRAKLNEDVVNEYADHMRNGAEFPVVTVFLVDGEDFYLVDGFHRMGAERQLEHTEIRCEVLTGTFQDALRYSLKANIKHGLRRTNEDKRNAIHIVLNVEEWRTLSDGVIGEMCSVDPKTVASVRKQLEEFEAREASYQGRMADQSTREIPELEPEKRQGKDGKWRSLPKPRAKQPVSDDEPADVQVAELEELSDDAADFDPFSGEDDDGPSIGVVKTMVVKSGTEIVPTQVRKQALADLGSLYRQLFKLKLYNRFEAYLEEIEVAIKDTESLEADAMAKRAA